MFELLGLVSRVSDDGVGERRQDLARDARPGATELCLPVRFVHPGAPRDDEIQERDNGRQLACGDDGIATFEAAPEGFGAGLTFTRERAVVETAAAGEPDILLARLTAAVVERWKRNDDQMLLLRLPKRGDLPRSVRRYLETDAARVARTAYKCRVRDPWYSVPDVQIPDLFLSYMSGLKPSLVRNDAKCTCTNSVHSVRIKNDEAAPYLRSWGSPFVQLSCEIEGHPLGGGMLKLEPREATQIVLRMAKAVARGDRQILESAIETLRTWRHYASAA
jgi:hypothetical protein